MDSKSSHKHQALTDIGMARLIHELEVHQIELEVQNEELMAAMHQIELDSDKYAELYDFAPVGYFKLAEDGTIIELNLRGSQMIGKDRTLVRYTRLGLLVSDDTLLLFNQFLKQLFLEKQRETCVLTLLVKNSTSIYVHLIGKVVDVGDYCFVTMTDITQRKLAEEALHQIHMRMEGIIQGAQVGTWEWNVQTGDTVFNEKWAQMAGYTLEELTPVSIQTWVNLLHPDDLEKSDNLAQRHFSGELPYYDCECRMKHKNGHWIWILDRGSLLTRTEDGKPLMMFGTHTDISEQKRVEEEIRQKNEQLVKLNAEKDRFFSIIAHDLRSPFNAFLGLTDLMVTDLPDLGEEEIHKIAHLLRNSASNLYGLLINLLDWSRLQSGITIFAPVTVPLLPIVFESMESMLETANKKGVEFINHISDDLIVCADVNMLSSIIRNLISNAVKFTPRGGKVAISAKQLPEGFLEISVSDTGIGVHPDMVDKLFCLDVDTSRKGTDGEPSTGLGLILCKDFIEKHGGNIEVGSVVGQGTTFRVRLPG